MSNITAPLAVLQEVMEAMDDMATDSCLLDMKQSRVHQFDAARDALRAALGQPQRKLTQRGIADSALLGNIESPFNACMHQEHCKRWKSQAGADSSLRAAVQQACDWISEEPGRRPISAGRLLAILINALSAAPKPPVVENMHTNPDPYLYYDPENGDTWTQEAIDDGLRQPDGLIALYTK